MSINIISRSEPTSSLNNQENTASSFEFRSQRQSDENGINLFEKFSNNNIHLTYVSDQNNIKHEAQPDLPDIFMIKKNFASFSDH